MKRMKKLFSKITTLVLLVAMLIPYTSIPKVEAEETCNGEWEYHTNYYFFLQAETPFSWAEMFKNNARSVTTAYYTGFLYNFPSDGSKIVFEDEGFVRITPGTRSSTNFNPATNRTQWTAADFYKELQSQNLSSLYSGNLQQYAFKASGNGTTESDRIVSYMFHGDWAHVNTSSSTRPNSSSNQNISWDLNNIDVRTGGLDTTETTLSKLANASILITNVAQNANITQAEIGSGTLNQGGNLSISIDQIQRAIQNYNNGVSEGTTIQKYNTSSEPVINMIIKRTYNFNDIFTNAVSSITTADDVAQSTNGQSGKVMALNTSNEEVELTLPLTENEKILIGSSDASLQKTVLLRDQYEHQNGEYWFLAPTLYQMSYKVCKASNNATEGTVTVTYDGNDANAQNVPKADTITSGNDYTVSTNEPTLSGNTFKNWNLSKKCDGKNIEPGAKLEKLTNNTTLYACWGSTEGTNGPGTGVLTYAGLFTGIIALAGGSYYLIKKKNVFKKI